MTPVQRNATFATLSISGALRVDDPLRPQVFQETGDGKLHAVVVTPTASLQADDNFASELELLAQSENPPVVAWRHTRLGFDFDGGPVSDDEIHFQFGATPPLGERVIELPVVQEALELEENEMFERCPEPVDTQSAISLPIYMQIRNPAADLAHAGDGT